MKLSRRRRRRPRAPSAVTPNAEADAVPPCPMRYGVLYLPLMVVRDQQLIEPAAKKMGLSDAQDHFGDAQQQQRHQRRDVVRETWTSPAPARQASSALWSKAEQHSALGSDRPRRPEHLGALAEHEQPRHLKSLKDFTPKEQDRHAGHENVACVRRSSCRNGQWRSSLGVANYTKLNPADGRPRPPGGGRRRCCRTRPRSPAHFTSPPYSYQEAKEFRRNHANDQLDPMRSATSR